MQVELFLVFALMDTDGYKALIYTVNGEDMQPGVIISGELCRSLHTGYL